LHSTNEELETINDELSLRTGELEDVSGFLESILSTLGQVVVVVDRALNVQVWNTGAEQMWGLRPGEAQGENFLGLDIGLPVERLKRPIRACLDGGADREQLTLQAVNRRGNSIQCRVTTVGLRGAGNAINGVIMLMDEAQGEAG
jgi:two-component system CheB/CheR fusion protein